MFKSTNSIFNNSKYQVSKKVEEELKKLDVPSNVQNLYDCVIILKREKEKMKRLDKNRNGDY